MSIDKIEKDELQGRLEDGLARHHVPGASVAVLRDGEIIAAAAGVANVTTGVAVTEDTVMHIGSITKVFNATLVMQLVDEGKISLDERVVRYLPDLKLKDPEAGEQITVRMLLNHTSGIDGAWLPDRGHDDETIEKTIWRCAALGQLFAPGVEFSYGNVPVVIAGYLAQRLTGTSWYQLIKERIFKPLQMEHAATLPEEALLHRASVGHFLRPGAPGQLVRTSHAFLGLGFAPAGSTLMMSARDLIAFASAHMSLGRGANAVRILSAASTKAMQRTTVNNKGKGYAYFDGVGLGWRLADEGLLFHAGGGPGIGAVLYAYPEHGFAVAIQANAAHCVLLMAELVEPWVKQVGTAKPFGMAEVPISTDSIRIDPDRYVGVYENVLTRHYVTRIEDGLAISDQLRFPTYDSQSTDAQPPVRLIPLGGDKFIRMATNELDAKWDANRLVAFRHPDVSGRPQLLGYSSHLSRRRLD